MTHDFEFDPATLTETEHTFSVVAHDFLGASSRQDWTVSVDHTPPVLATSGSLSDLQTAPIADSYDLSVSAADADPIGASSGTDRIVVLVDGQVAGSANQACVLGGCELSFDFAYATRSFGAGTHTVTVVAIDRAGNAATSALQVKANYPIPLENLFKASTAATPPPGVTPEAVMAQRALVTDWLSRGTGGLPLYTKTSATDSTHFAPLSANAPSARYVAPDGTSMTAEQYFAHFNKPGDEGSFDPATPEWIPDADPIGGDVANGNDDAAGQATQAAADLGTVGDWVAAAGQKTQVGTSPTTIAFDVVRSIGAADVTERYATTLQGSVTCSSNGWACTRSGNPYELGPVSGDPNCFYLCPPDPAVARAVGGNNGSGFLATFHMDCTNWPNPQSDSWCFSYQYNWSWLYQDNDAWPHVPSELADVQADWVAGQHFGVLPRNRFHLQSRRAYDPSRDSSLPHVGGPADPPDVQDDVLGPLTGAFTTPSSLTTLLETKLKKQADDDVKCKLAATGIGIAIPGTTKAELLGIGLVQCKDGGGNGDPANVPSIVVTVNIGPEEAVANCSNQWSCTAHVETSVDDRIPNETTTYWVVARAAASVPVEPSTERGPITIPPD